VVAWDKNFDHVIKKNKQCEKYNKVASLPVSILLRDISILGVSISLSVLKGCKKDEDKDNISVRTEPYMSPT